MSPIGLTPDQLLAATWSGPSRASYVLRSAELNVLRGETIALVGDGCEQVLARLGERLPACMQVEGAGAAAAGTLRIHAQQAVRVGMESLIVSDPFGDLDEAARSLAVADLAGLRSLGVTTLVAVADVDLGAAFADRVAVVREARVVAAYPVVAPAPRSPGDIEPVSRRVTSRLADGG
jgi:predicted ABC-type transport system involved in lysophospholipase L1 biosynthesis ATPase subunit